ncbi:MAG TPA: endolytic transglycosylase MltG [Usitatibacter sp.]|nr:endolytic transglycosylase MltG [Usitatibacter sp.]
MRVLRNTVAAALVVVAAIAGWLAWFATHPVALPATPFDFTVHTGASLKGVSRQLARDGLFREGESFWILARLLGKGRTIQAGTYRLDHPITPLELLEKMRRGDVVLVEMLFVEGTTLRQWLAQLAAEPRVRHAAAGKADADLRAALEIAEPSAEGWFFPDTYRFAPGVSDLEILKRAHGAMKKRLAEAWESKDAALPLRTPYEALILASIIEKETAVPEERPLVSSVFVNRLRRGMRLQTDPTVIYGMGESYDGNIRKKDLTADTPWNTYTRDGLPPTPIAMPGLGSLRAAAQPAKSDYLYFVSRGDGTHEFSRSLEEHNRAVAKYQLHR